MLEVVMEYYLVGLVVTLLMSLVYLSINLFRDKINMFTDKGVMMVRGTFIVLSAIIINQCNTIRIINGKYRRVL